MHETHLISHIQLPTGEMDEKLKPLSTNIYCINDIFGFIDEIKNTSINLTIFLSPMMCQHYSPMFL